MARWLSVLCIALALVVAGCGGGDESASDTTATETTTQSTTTDETSTDETSTDTSGLDTDATFAWASEDCQSLVKAYVGLSAAIAAASTGQDVSGDIEAFSEYVDQLPEEIRADVEALASAYGTFVDELQAIGVTPGEVPTAEQLQALDEASKSVSDPDVQAAGERLSAWTTENCTS